MQAAEAKRAPADEEKREYSNKFPGQTAEEVWTVLGHHLEEQYASLAGSNSGKKPAQKARVVMAMVNAVNATHAAADAKSNPPIWDTFGDPLVESQVADLRQLFVEMTSTDLSSYALQKLEQNLVARAGLLIDLGLIERTVYEKKH